jgi:hypothetical protein
VIEQGLLKKVIFRFAAPEGAPDLQQGQHR